MLSQSEDLQNHDSLVSKLSKCEKKLIQALNDYISYYRETRVPGMVSVDIYKIDLITFENDQRIPALSPMEQVSLLTAWRILNFIVNCENLLDDFDCPKKNEPQFRFYVAFQHIEKVKNNLEDSLSNLFDIHFDKIFSVLSEGFAEEYINEIKQFDYGYSYDHYLDLIRGTVTNEQLDNIITVENCDEMLTHFLTSSLNDRIKFLIIEIFHEKYEQNNINRQFFDSLGKLAKKGVYAAAFWFVVSDDIDHADFHFNMQDHFSLIKRTLSCARMEVHKSTVIQYIFKLIAAQAMCISEIDVKALLGLAQPVMDLFDEHLNLLTIRAKHAMICAIENNRKDLMCFAYPIKLNVAAIINSIISGKDKDFIATLFENYKIPDEVLEYLKNTREIIKSARLLGEAYRTPDNALCFFHLPQKELLYRIAAHAGNAKEGEMKEAMELAQQYFSRP